MSKWETGKADPSTTNLIEMAKLYGTSPEELLKGNQLMNQNIINYYENYKEEDRLTTNNARKIEFLTTIHFFEKHFHGKLKILDCAAAQERMRSIWRIKVTS